MELEAIDDLFIKRKVHISTVGWITAIISGLSIYFIAVNILNIILFNQNKEIQEVLMDLTGEVNEQMESVQRLIIFIKSVFGIITIFFLYSAIGLIHYKTWARKVFATSSWIFIGLSFFGLLFYAFIFNNFTSNLLPLQYKDAFGIVRNDMLGIIGIRAKIKMISYAVILIGTIRALFRICLSFNKVEYKRLFM